MTKRPYSWTWLLWECTITPTCHSIYQEKTFPSWAVFTEPAKASCWVRPKHALWFWSKKNYLSMWSDETWSGSATAHPDLKKKHAEAVTNKVRVKQGDPISPNQLLCNLEKGGYGFHQCKYHGVAKINYRLDLCWWLGPAKPHMGEDAKRISLLESFLWVHWSKNPGGRNVMAFSSAPPISLTRSMTAAIGRWSM